MNNPCKECIVDVMCRNYCDILDDHLEYLINKRCKFQNMTKPYKWWNLGKEIRFRQEGRIIMHGVIGKSDYGIHIYFDRGKIISILRYPTIFSEDKKRRMALYDPKKGVKLYGINHKPM